MRNQVKQLRVAEGWTQTDLAIKVGVRRETIGFLEKGKYNPSLMLAHGIAQCFGKSIEDVFMLDDADPNSDK